MTETIQKTDSARLLAQMRDLRQWYGRLLDLTRLQCGSTDSYEGMDDILKRKRSVMEEIDAVGLDFASMRERWEGVRESLPEGERAEAAETIKSLQSILREIIEMENRWHGGVLARKEETLHHIRKLHGGRKIVRAYGRPAAETAPRFLDKTE